VLEAHRETGVRSTLLGFHAEALYRLGRYDEAARSTRKSEEIASLDDVLSQVLWRSVRGKVIAQAGDPERAHTLSSEAVDLLEASDGLDMRGDVFLNRAEVLRIAGRTEEARADADKALALYEQKRNIVSARRARNTLAQLVP
jgi:tetratricopeptide (TPR) repeat protein